MHFALMEKLIANGQPDMVLCKCFDHLEVFDCDEEVGANLVKIFCVEKKQESEAKTNTTSSTSAKANLNETRDVLAAVRKLTQDEPVTEKAQEVTDKVQEHPKYEGSKNETDVRKNKKEEGETFGLVALVLGLLALLLIAGLGTKSCLDSRRERKKRDIADKIAAAAAATGYYSGDKMGRTNASFEEDSVSVSEISSTSTSSTSTSRQANPSKNLKPSAPPKRLMSLSAGPFVFEKH